MKGVAGESARRVLGAAVLAFGFSVHRKPTHESLSGGRAVELIQFFFDPLELHQMIEALLLLATSQDLPPRRQSN